MDNSTFIWHELQKLKEEQRQRDKELYQELELPLYYYDEVVYNEPKKKDQEEVENAERGVIIIQM